MKGFLTMYRVEQKLFLRTPDVLIFNLMMTLVTFLLITMIAGGKDAADSGLTYGMAVPVLTLTVMAVLCGAVAVKTFRWE